MRFKRCCCFFTSKQFIFQRFITFWNQTHDVIDYHTSHFSVCCSFSKVYSCVCCYYSKVYSSYYVLWVDIPTSLLLFFSRFSLSSWTYFSPISSFYSDICRIKTRSICTLVSSEKCSTVWESYLPRLCKPS